jgi:Beta-1,3-glucanase/Carbohydrate binding module (family 6)
MTPQTLNIALKNNTSSPTVYAYITGQDTSRNSVLLIQSDGHTPYYPASPSSSLSPLAVDCGIRLGPSGSTITITIPRISSARVWVSIDTPLVFLLNPGPGLVEPSVTNPSDPNIATTWGFCELTFNEEQLYANISYVDFVSVPISLALTNSSGEVKSVLGIPNDGLDTVCAQLASQQSADGKGWGGLIVSSGGRNLRALSPNLGTVVNPSLFQGYFDPYVNQVWSKYTSTSLLVDTQATWGVVSGTVGPDGQFTFPGLGSFSKPSTRDIFSCSTGPFVVTSAAMAALVPRLSAAFNRSTLLLSSSQPSANTNQYYMNPITNHYSRIVHQVSVDKRGYAFPYDDVAPSGGVDQSGSVFDPNPTLLTITVGGVSGVQSPVNPPNGNPGSGQSGSPRSAASITRAESFTSSNGTNTEPCSDVGGGRDVGWIANGDWLRFDSIDFGSGMSQFKTRVASGAPEGVSGLVNVVLDNLTAPPVASLAVANTGGWQSWETVPANMSTVSGVHNVFLVFASGQPEDFVNVNWFTFS